MADSDEALETGGTPTACEDGGDGAAIQDESAYDSTAPGKNPGAVPTDIDEADDEDSLVSEFLLFLREEKKWWLAPMVLVLIAIAGLFAYVEGSAVAPFIYTLF
jgi:hypothetical protein